MASINGICVKSMKEFKGHEGEPLCQGNLYLGNKKLGFWSQDAWGGPDNFDFDKPYSERLLNEAVKRMNSEKAKHGVSYSGEPYVLEYDLKLLLCDYTCLLIDEKEFKKAVKAGYAGVLILTDGYHMVTWKLPESYLSMSDKTILDKLADAIEREKQSFFKNTEHTVKIYRSLEDFKIGEPIKLEDILEKPV